MQFIGGVTRKIGCKQYSKCLKREAMRRGSPSDFDCKDCRAYEDDHWTEREKEEEKLRCANLLIAIFPELATADPAGHEELAMLFKIADALSDQEVKTYA